MNMLGTNHIVWWSVLCFDQLILKSYIVVDTSILRPSAGGTVDCFFLVYTYQATTIA